MPTVTSKVGFKVLMDRNVLINEIFVRATQVPGEPDLTGVRIVSMHLDFMIIEKAGSVGAEQFFIRYDDIVAVDIAADQVPILS
ncbi:hypothetical protein [Bacillus kwashiorkori]|uniref:hypothetical protein n=1 Tax=Bacillus kwashiorkori TaxID=1522318 RepID=UPI00078064A5|nr:hypothetical protein [Bacillus kwashiorkori]